MNGDTGIEAESSRYQRKKKGCGSTEKKSDPDLGRNDCAVVAVGTSLWGRNWKG